MLRDAMLNCGFNFIRIHILIRDSNDCEMITWPHDSCKEIEDLQGLQRAICANTESVLTVRAILSLSRAILHDKKWADRILRKMLHSTTEYRRISKS